MKTLEVIPPRQLSKVSVTLPGSKSITNRALLLAALAEGSSRLTGALKSDDTKYMAKALGQLGVKITEPNATTFVIQGTGGKFVAPKKELFLGNAGTATRFLTAATCLVNGRVVITGDKHMQTRPIADLVDALQQLGVKINYLGKAGCPPLEIISTGTLKAKNKVVKIRGNISSQFVSALLMILPFTNAQLKITGKLASRDYLEITEKISARFRLGKKYLGKNIYIEPDASSATYFWAAKKLLRQPIKIANDQKKYLQPDALAKTIIEDFPNLPKEISGERFPDAIPTLAVLAAFGNSTVRFGNIANLRVKECDRIRALALNLNRIKPGLAKEVGNNLVVHGDPLLWQHGQSAKIETFDDHRIAMAFSLAGLKIAGIQISDPDCVAKSFPDYWKTLKRLGIKLV